MKKMNKALAVLTVLAMLATLFVAVPASAGKVDCQPTISVLFTSDAAMEEPVNPDELAANQTFYAWLQFGGLDTDAYIDTATAFITWDADVVIPWREKNDVTYDSTKAKNYKNAMVDSPDFVKAEQAYRTDYDDDDDEVIYGAYKCGTNDLSEHTFYVNVKGVVNTNVFGVEFMPGNNGDITESMDTFVQANADGTFTMYGFGFKKLTGGKVGVTVPAMSNTKVLNGNDVAQEPSNSTALIEFTDMPQTIGDSAILTGYTYNGAGVDGQIIDNSPADGQEAPTTQEPQEPTGADVDVVKEASKSTALANAFYYDFTLPVIEDATFVALTATAQLAGQEVQGKLTKPIDLSDISNVALKIAAVIKNIPDAHKTTDITTSYTLTYSVGGVEKTLAWECSDSLN